MERVEFNLNEVLNCVKDGITYKQINSTEIIGYQLCALTSNPFDDYIKGNLNIPAAFITIRVTMDEAGKWKTEVPFEELGKICTFYGEGTDLSKSLALGINMYDIMSTISERIRSGEDKDKVFNEIPDFYLEIVSFRDALPGEIPYNYPVINAVIIK